MKPASIWPVQDRRTWDIASVPDRPELNYNYLFDLIDELGYDGWIGCRHF
jgi:hydroxypyruvate isomerase